MTNDVVIKVNLEQSECSGKTLGTIAKFPDKKTPFNCLTFQNLLETKQFDQLREDIISKVELDNKHNDLYKFKQSKDLRSEIDRNKLTPRISSFCDVMLNAVRNNLEKLTGLKLSGSQFDITASRYDQADYLLCHNDDIKDSTRKRARALAFIFYLNTRPWTEDDGGALILYDSDEAGEPIAVNNLIYPGPNTLLVFETSPTSWHSVQEVLCEGNDDQRLSINGWFHHEDPLQIEKLYKLHNFLEIEPSPFTFARPVPLDERLERFFNECINGEYLMEKTCFMVRRQFKRKSEINLSNFLVPEKYKEISEALLEVASKQKEDQNLQHVGPYNKRNYKRLNVDKLPQICRDLYDAFKSELFFILVSRLTGLDLQPAHLVHEKQIDDFSSSSEDDSDVDEESENGETSQGSREGTETEDDHDDDKVGEEEEQGEIRDQTKEDAGGSALGKESVDMNTNEPAQGEATKEMKKKEKVPCDPLARLEFRHLTVGSYSLIHDYAFERGEQSALDVILHFNHDFEINLEHGGYIGYIDAFDEETPEEGACSDDLLRVEPESNCLSLVYRSDKSTCRFLKYITHLHKSNYQDLSCVYYERPGDLPNGAPRPVAEVESEVRENFVSPNKRAKLDAKSNESFN